MDKARSALDLLIDGSLALLAYVALVYVESERTAALWLFLCSAAFLAHLGLLWLLETSAPFIRPALIIRSAFALWYIVPLLQLCLRGHSFLDDRPYYPPVPELLSAACLVFAAQFVFAGTHYLAGLAMGRVQKTQAQHNALEVPVWVIAVQLVIGCIPIGLADGSLLDTLLAGRSTSGAFRTEVKGSAETLASLLQFFLMSGCLLAMQELTRLRRGRIVVMGIGLLALAANSLASGTRTLLIMLAMPAWTEYMPGRTNSMRRWAVTAGLGVLLITGSEALVANRSRGFAEVEIPVAGSIAESRVLRDSDFFTELLYCVQVSPSLFAFTYESPLLHLLTGLVPRALWPGKPDPVAVDQIMFLRLMGSSGELRGNILPGILGQYWSAGGWIGILFAGCWLGLFSAWAERRLEASSDPQVRYYVFGLAWAAFVSFRMLAPSNFVPALLAVGTVWIVRQFQGRRRVSGESVAPNGFRGGAAAWRAS